MSAFAIIWIACSFLNLGVVMTTEGWKKFPRSRIVSMVAVFLMGPIYTLMAAGTWWGSR